MCDLAVLNVLIRWTSAVQAEMPSPTRRMVLQLIANVSLYLLDEVRYRRFQRGVSTCEFLLNPKKGRGRLSPMPFGRHGG